MCISHAHICLDDFSNDNEHYQKNQILYMYVCLHVLYSDFSDIIAKIFRFYYQNRYIIIICIVMNENFKQKIVHLQLVNKKWQFFHVSQKQLQSVEKV